MATNWMTSSCSWRKHVQGTRGNPAAAGRPNFHVEIKDGGHDQACRRAKNLPRARRPPAAMEGKERKRKSLFLGPPRRSLHIASPRHNGTTGRFPPRAFRCRLLRGHGQSAASRLRRAAGSSRLPCQAKGAFFTRSKPKRCH